MKELLKDGFGITSILGAVLSKEGLVPWSAREAGKAYDSFFRRLLEESNGDHSYLADALRYAIGVDAYKFSESVKERAASRGTDGHAICETLARAYDEDIPLSDTHVADFLRAAEPLQSPDVYLMALAFRDWLERETPVIMGSEKPVACPHCGYGATIDLQVILRKEPWVLEIKTSKGIWDEMALQVTAQIHALLNTAPDWQIDRKTKWNAHRYSVRGEPQPHRMNPVAPVQAPRAGILWIGPDAKQGCELIEVARDEEEFLSVLRLFRWRKKAKWNLGHPSPLGTGVGTGLKNAPKGLESPVDAK